MAAEADPTSLSNFRLVIDGFDLGQFKSSGIIISTGSGSSGWLYSARYVSPKKVN